MCNQPEDPIYRSKYNKKHLDTIYKTMKLIEKDSGSQKCLRNADSGGDSSDGTGTPQTKQQCTIIGKSSMSATKLLSLISEYVVESTADSPAFKKLIGGVHAIQVPG